jgi:hypothetical protein
MAGLPEDMTVLVLEFNTAGVTDVIYRRWLGNATVVAGTAIDDGFEPLVLSPWWVFVPRVPKSEIARIPVGDRQRDGCLVWSIAVDGLGNGYNTLRAIHQATRTRGDLIVDNDHGLTYEVVAEWKYGKQALVSGAIGLLINA